MREHLPLPKRIRDAPSVPLGLELYYEAFWELSSCRSVGWSLGPIPWSETSHYASFHDFDEVQTERLLYFIRELDKAFLEYHRPKKTAHEPIKAGKR